MAPIRLILFDLDGVLVAGRDLHFHALNQALQQEGLPVIDRETHLTLYDGLPTRVKLERMGLTPEQRQRVEAAKQDATVQAIYMQVQPDPAKIALLQALRRRGYRIGVVSNALFRSITLMLSCAGLAPWVDFWLGNEDGDPKPSTALYLQAMLRGKAAPRDTVIVEDAPAGRRSAEQTGATVLGVRGPEDVTMERLEPLLTESPPHPTKWQAPQLTVLIPMAGAGKRFEQAGYSFPKPLIEVRGKPMVQCVVENLAVQARFVFVVRREHCERYALRALLQLIAPGCSVIEVEQPPTGAAVDTLAAAPVLGEGPLLLANSDQVLEWDAAAFYHRMLSHSDIDGGIVTFRATHPKWSFVRLDEKGYVAEVAEKRPISDVATCGLYYWRSAADYVKYASAMIQANERVNNEFYVAPVYNRALADGARVVPFPVQAMHGLGTPEDLRAYVEGR